MDPRSLKPIDPQIFNDVHRAIGAALWSVQPVEDTLAHFIAAVLRYDPAAAEAEMRTVLEDLQTKALGNLIRALKQAKNGTAVDEFERRMNAFLAERNWLVHHSWREHQLDVYFPEKAMALIERLARLSHEAGSFNRFFGDLVVRWTLDNQGVSQDELNAEIKSRLAADGVLRDDTA